MYARSYTPHYIQQYIKQCKIIYKLCDKFPELKEKIEYIIAKAKRLEILVTDLLNEKATDQTEIALILTYIVMPWDESILESHPSNIKNDYIELQNALTNASALLYNNLNAVFKLNMSELDPEETLPLKQINMQGEEETNYYITKLIRTLRRKAGGSLQDIGLVIAAEFKKMRGMVTDQDRPLFNNAIQAVTRAVQVNASSIDEVCTAVEDLENTINQMPHDGNWGKIVKGCLMIASGMLLAIGFMVAASFTDGISLLGLKIAYGVVGAGVATLMYKGARKACEGANEKVYLNPRVRDMLLFARANILGNPDNNQMVTLQSAKTR
jgi:hypothetical protein